ncbi:hypothetical protein PtB15_15B161 [Puccinia triticina]|nr:hypothetical protein PtB15_15B161 [Puccinia triticina]
MPRSSPSLVLAPQSMSIGDCIRLHSASWWLPRRAGAGRKEGIDTLPFPGTYFAQPAPPSRVCRQRGAPGLAEARCVSMAAGRCSRSAELSSLPLQPPPRARRRPAAAQHTAHPKHVPAEKRGKSVSAEDLHRPARSPANGTAGTPRLGLLRPSAGAHGPAETSEEHSQAAASPQISASSYLGSMGSGGKWTGWGPPAEERHKTATDRPLEERTARASMQLHINGY